MLSRVADSLFWMSRYMERTDSILRMLKINYASSQDNVQEFTWRPVLKIFTYLEEEEIRLHERNTRDILQLIVTNRENPNSVINLVTKSRENARSVQDNITKELWQCLNDFYHIARDERVERSLKTGDPIAVLDTLIRQGMLYYGILESTMFQGEGLCYINIGKYLERAVQSADILDVKFGDLPDDLEKITDPTYWKYLLLSISGYALYLKTYRSGFEARNVVDQVIFNTNFPRSVLHSLNQLHSYFEKLKSKSDPENFAKIEFMIGKIRSQIQYSDVQKISRTGLHRYLTDIKQELNLIGMALSQRYFAYS